MGWDKNDNMVFKRPCHSHSHLILISYISIHYYLSYFCVKQAKMSLSEHKQLLLEYEAAVEARIIKLTTDMHEQWGAWAANEHEKKCTVSDQSNVYVLCPKCGRYCRCHNCKICAFCCHYSICAKSCGVCISQK